MVLITDCVNLLSLKGLRQGSGSAYRHTKINIHQQVVDNIFFQAIKLFGLIRTLTVPFPSLHSPVVLYCALVTPKSKRPLLRGILSLLLML